MSAYYKKTDNLFSKEAVLPKYTGLGLPTTIHTISLQYTNDSGSLSCQLLNISLNLVELFVAKTQFVRSGS